MHSKLLRTFNYWYRPLVNNLSSIGPMSVSKKFSVEDGSFLYYGFGSNLLTERIHVNNPSARKLDIGKLKEYKLDFNQYSNRWKGAVATINWEKDSHVYGILWIISNEDLKKLDIQEGVDKGMYRPISVSVERSTGDMVDARSYQLINLNASDTRPSSVYLNVIIKGAKEHGLPKDYVQNLEKIEHNGYDGDIDVKLSI